MKWVALPWGLPKAPSTQFTNAFFLSQGVKAALPNAQKQTLGGCQIEETKKYGPNERTEQNPRKMNKMKITNLSDAEFKTLVIRMLKEVTEHSKNIREEMKVTLSEIKNL